MTIYYENINTGSYVSIFIETIATKNDGTDGVTGTGSGFFYSYDNKDFLITNWHVLTSRIPENPARLLSKYPKSPNKIRINFFIKNNFGATIQIDRTIDLYSNGKPVWIETSKHGKRFDLAAIELNFKKEGVVSKINDMNVGSTNALGILQDVVIIGHPYKLDDTYVHPVWKHASIATEPSLKIGGLPRFYVDTPGLPGMSGSPVFRTNSGFIMTSSEIRDFDRKNKQHSALEAISSLPSNLLERSRRLMLQFVGVYSGTVGDENLRTLGLGVVWNASCLDRLFKYSSPGINPWPPP